MAQLLLINPKVKPSSRRKRNTIVKKKRSAAQQAATRKMIKYNKRHRRKQPEYKGVKSVPRLSNPTGGKVMAKKRRSKRKSNPVRTLKSVRHHGKPASRAAFRKSGYSRNPIRSRHIKRRSNPIAKLGLGGIVKNTIMPAAVGAGGAITLDLLWSFLPIPVSIKTGPMRHAAKGVGAIGLGLLAGMLIKKDTANALATGAMTVVMYNAAREAVAQFAPNIALGEYMAIESQPVGMGEFLEGHSDGIELDGIGMEVDDYSMNGLYDGASDSF